MAVPAFNAALLLGLSGSASFAAEADASTLFLPSPLAAPPGPVGVIAISRWRDWRHNISCGRRRR